MSIRLRLTLYWTAVLGAILLGAALAVFALFQRAQWGTLDAALLEEVDEASAAIAQAGRAGAKPIVVKLSQERDLGARRRVMLIDSQGRMIAEGGRADADPPTFLSANPQIVNGARRIFRYAIFPLTLEGEQVWLEDGVDARAERDSIGRLRTILLLMTPAVLLLCAAGGFWLAGRALAPIAALGTALAAIHPRKLSSRLPAPRVADEIGRLTATINALLERVELASAAERRFASDAAHELRTPLTVLRSGLEVALGRERTQAEDREALVAALAEVVRLCKMAEDLLALARLDGEVAIERARVDLKQMLLDLTEELRPVADAKNLALDATLDAAEVLGSETHLRRLAINLLDNAFKFTPAGGKVKVTLRNGNGAATLCVADTGPGIPATEMPQVFERFFRGKGVSGGGSGLGLSLCREIARLHGATIRAANRTGGGCELIVTLPLA